MSDSSPGVNAAALNSQLSAFNQLCDIVARLRAPDGCPWDREQTNETLLPGLIEEAYEVAGAVRAQDDQNLREELGDLILLAVMHSQIAEENGRFNIASVLEDVTAKLIRRHPHVFGESEVRDTDGVVKQWEAIKREEKNDAGRPLPRRSSRGASRLDARAEGSKESGARQF